jgi:hypothetical protein
MSSSLKNKAILSVASIATLGTIGFVGLTGTGMVQAQANENEYPLIIQKLAEKFGVEASEVQNVFEETKDQLFVDRLTEAVENGDITEDQKSLIIEKQAEFETRREEIDNQSLTAAERRDAMQTLHEEMRNWAEENGIDMHFLMGGKHIRMGKGEMISEEIRGGEMGNVMIMRDDL